VVPPPLVRENFLMQQTSKGLGFARGPTASPHRKNKRKKERKKVQVGGVEKNI